MKTENSTDEMQINLFTGDLEKLRDPRGRKSFRPTQENRLLVSVLSARGFTHDNILTFMGAQEEAFPKDGKTLRKHFSRELKYGRVFIEGMAAQALVAKMMTGNMAAINKVLKDCEAAVPTPKSQTQKKVEPLGKKAALDKGAGELTSGWGDLLKSGKPVN